MMAPKYLMLNGPKHSGKDTIGQALNAKIIMSGGLSVRDKFAEPLKDTACAVFGLTHSERLHYFENSAVKDAPAKRFMGLTPRNLLISLSETWFKPTFGSDIFGKLLLERTKHLEGFSIVTDGGFNEELEPFDKTDIAVIRLHRSGCDFTGDSRSYVDRDDVFSFDVTNNNTPEFVAEAILYKLKKEGFLND